MPVITLTKEEIELLDKNVSILPLDALTCTLREAIDQTNKKMILSPCMNFSGCNLFLFDYSHWQIIGNVLSKLQIKELRISWCNFDLTLVRFDRQQHMNWLGFSDMLRKTSIELISGNNIALERGFNLDLALTLKQNAISNEYKHQPTLKNAAAFFIAKQNLSYSLLPLELRELVTEQQERINKITLADRYHR